MEAFREGPASARPGAAPPGPSHPRRADVVIVGAGLAGTAAAHVMARQGLDVVLIEASPEIARTLRAEKLGEEAMAQFERLGLAQAVRPVVTPIYSLWVARFGRLMTRGLKREYGFAYADLIAGLRAALPPTVDLRFGRIAEAACGPDRQRIVLADGATVEARLMVIATGHGDALRRGLGIAVDETHPDHSMCIGFDLSAPPSAFPFEAMVFFGHRRESRVAYLSLFPIGTRMRANLFVYRTTKEAWTHDFRRAPTQVLHATLPDLERLCGRIEVAGPVEIRPIGLRRVREPVQAGVVLVGDAFSTVCPITGTGLRKALTDIERLCGTHLPAWLATPGMGQDKIAGYYADPVKTAFDAGSLDSSELLRAVTLGEGGRFARRPLVRRLRTRLSFAAHRSADVAAGILATIVSLI